MSAGPDQTVRLPGFFHVRWQSRSCRRPDTQGHQLRSERPSARPSQPNERRQVLGCALAEPDRDWHISRVGVYHVWEAHLAEWNLEPVNGHGEFRVDGQLASGLADVSSPGGWTPDLRLGG